VAKVGRPSKYSLVDIDQVERLSLLGLTDEEMAAFYGINVATLYRWKNEHSEFSEALKKGKEEADGHVARSLYNEAVGGNVTAQIYWLKNRQPKKWRDKPEEINKDNSKESVDFDFEEIK